MYRLASASSRGTEQVAVRVIRRKLATETVPTSAPVPPVAKPNKIRIRSYIIYSSLAFGTFYVSSAFIALHNPTYYKFVQANVPLGPKLLEYAEDSDWDTVNSNTILRLVQNAVTTVRQTYNRTIGGNASQPASEESQGKAETLKTALQRKNEALKARASSAKKSIADKVDEVKSQAAEGSGAVQKQLENSQRTVTNLVSNTVSSAKEVAMSFSEGVEELVREAESALRSSQPDSLSVKPSDLSALASAIGSEVSESIDDNKIWTSPLPLGHEPPFGFSRPAPTKKPEPMPKKETSPPPPPLPLIAPSVSVVTASEPIIAHLASTIDNLASTLQTSASASNTGSPSSAQSILDAAKADLESLVTHIAKIKEDEKLNLQRKIDEQTRQYSNLLLELEIESQDRLDNQEQDFRKLFDEEKVKFLQIYREKLENELKTQTELINERLKEEVIAQGIELQRRWIRDIKVKVEQERGGRLSKLDELAANLKRLERVALDNSTYLDENLRVHAIWSALRAVSNVMDAPVRKPFREELRVLRHIFVTKDDPVIASALDAIESSDIPDVGVEPFADLALWFTTTVAPRVSTVALVPDHNAGLISHLTSHFFSNFRFQRKGFVEGTDVLSVLARADYYMTERDLDSATRELNQLNGTAKEMLEDWLNAARRRLEVMQALEIINAQATLASLSVV